MKHILGPALLACLLASPAAAQQAPDPAAIAQEVMECVGAKIQLRTKINQIEAELAKMKTPPGPPTSSAP